MRKVEDSAAEMIVAPVSADMPAGDDQTGYAAGLGKQHGGVRAVVATPGVLALLSTSIIGRLPLAMLSIVLLVHTQRLTGSFAIAGLVTGSYTVGIAVSAPILGRLADRCGQLVVLIGTALAASVLLSAMALVPASVPRAVLVVLAAGIGLATPPLGGCVRALLPEILPAAEALPAVYAVESSALELTFIFGPPLALGLAALWSTRAALASAGLVLLAAAAGFATRPASRRWRPPPAGRRRGGALRPPAMRTLVVVMTAVGVLFGATEVGVTAAATRLGRTDSAGLLLALWGVGSMAGGVVATRRGGGARSVRGLALILAALALGHAALAVTTSSLVAVGAVLLVAGIAISPAYATVYTMVGRAAPEGTVTEAFAWLSTAVVTGGSAGNAAAGALAQGTGVAAAFVLAGAAGALAVVIAVLRSRTLVPCLGFTAASPSAIPAHRRDRHEPSSTVSPLCANGSLLIRDVEVQAGQRGGGAVRRRRGCCAR
jgi:MFS family permease